nr:venom polypeptide precursor [Doratifera vulnerans]
MKAIIVLCLALISKVAADTYTDKYDNMNMEEIMENCRMLVPYEKCVLGKQKCTKEGEELKSHIKEAIEDKCAKCTDTQKEKIKRGACILSNCQPTFWKQAMAMYDPDQKHLKKNQAEYNQATKCEVDCNKYKECDLNTGRPVGE